MILAQTPLEQIDERGKFRIGRLALLHQLTHARIGCLALCCQLAQARVGRPTVLREIGEARVGRLAVSARSFRCESVRCCASIRPSTVSARRSTLPPWRSTVFTRSPTAASVCPATVVSRPTASLTPATFSVRRSNRQPGRQRRRHPQRARPHRPRAGRGALRLFAVRLPGRGGARQPALVPDAAVHRAGDRLFVRYIRPYILAARRHADAPPPSRRRHARPWTASTRCAPTRGSTSRCSSSPATCSS